jgi:hypothetical protein
MMCLGMVKKGEVLENKRRKRKGDMEFFWREK